MSHSVLLQLAGILVLGIMAQWVAWRIRLPSILLLLAAGIVAGPITGWLHPDELFGDLMLPVVSLSVAIILYEGGLNLRLQELKSVGAVFLRLTTIGVAISWITAAAAARFLLGFGWPVATLLGAILVVTGPTVIGPILRHLRMRGKAGALLKWEGIIIDPVGASLAVLVFTVVQAGAIREGMNEAVMDLGLTLLAGVVIGGVTATALAVGLSRYWIPDSLHNAVSLMLVLVAFTAANAVQEESGLLAVTVMGIVLANQKWAPIRHVVAFKESLTVLLISCLFIVLSARLQLADLQRLGWESAAFVAVLIFVSRPLSVLAATLGSNLAWKERCFLACMAPRGIVAAAISSVFALSLDGAGHPRALEIVPVVFLVVFVTVLLYGALAAPLARALGLIQANPQGILFVGGDAWVRAVAKGLRDEGCPVFLIDSDWQNVRQARMTGLPCLHGSALSEMAREEIDYAGLGRMLAVTPNNEVNSLACLHYAEDFGRQNVYQLAFQPDKEGRHEVVSQEHRGRMLFGQDWTYSALSERMGPEPAVKKTRLTAEFDFKAFQAEHGESVLPLFVLKPDGTVAVRTAEGWTPPKAGDLVLSAVLAVPGRVPSDAQVARAAG